MTLVTSLWGAIGSFTHVIGYHHGTSNNSSPYCLVNHKLTPHAVWEFWLNNAWNFQAAAWNSYYVIMLSEVVPQPKMYMFFSLLNCMGKTSSFIGPFISSAIIARAGGNTNMAYWFLFGTGLVGILLLACVSTDKAKVDVARFLEREAEQLYSERQRTDATEIVVHEAQTEVVACSTLSRIT
jgi:hypothetical protein